ncbi:MAG: glycoside hydrolase family 28 protein [Sphaerochaeta sp.]
MMNTEYGPLVGDGVTDNTKSLQGRFDALNEGDELTIPKGVYATGALRLAKKNVTITFEEGAHLHFIADPELYPPVYTRWEGVNCWALHPALMITHSEHVHLRGSGVLDGGGSWWWEEARTKKVQPEPITDLERSFAALNPGFEHQSGGGGGRQSQFLRPPLLQIFHSSSIHIEGLTLQNSPFWTLHPLYSEKIVIDGVTIINPKMAPNTDGIDIDSCTNVVIRHCYIDVGDDGIALKSGSGSDGVKTAWPTVGVTIERCTVKSAHGGAVIGSETAAGVRNVLVEHCLFDGTDRGIRIKTRRGRGGRIENLHYRNLTMKNNLCPIAINMYYRPGSKDMTLFSLDAKPILDTTPSISNILIEACQAHGSTSSAGFIVGLPEEPIHNLTIKDSSLGVNEKNLTPIEESEMYEGLPEINNRGVRLRNVSIHLQEVKVLGVADPFVIEDGVTIL